MLVAVLVAGSAIKARAVVLAYEGFNYTAGVKIVDSNGDDVYDDGLGAAGGGWAGAWDNTQGVTPDASVIQAGSLGYTDGLGNALTTSGGLNLAYSGTMCSRKYSIPFPGRPIDWMMPASVSAMRGVGLPSRGSRQMVLATSAPSRLRSMTSLYSHENAPDAG